MATRVTINNGHEFHVHESYDTVMRRLEAARARQYPDRLVELHHECHGAERRLTVNASSVASVEER